MPNNVFQSIKDQFKAALPFVVYRKPLQTHVSGIFLENDRLTYTDDLCQPGFVFAPYDSGRKTVLFPSEAPTIFENDTAQEALDLRLIGSNELISQSLKDTHIALVQRGIQAIKKGEMKKVVLSRKQAIPIMSNAPDIIFARLLQHYPAAMVYCWYHPKVGLWAGATPETLITTRGDIFKTMSLAGTMPVTDETVPTWGKKEIEEQEYVTKSIVTQLESIGATVRRGNLETHQAGALWHLKTMLQGRVPQKGASLQEIVKVLHPTPAVCGLPREAAQAFITKEEGYDRTFYTGYLGEVNISASQTRPKHRRNTENLAYKTVHQRSHLFVNLRCMQLTETSAHLYVGGGITKDSIPQAEWEETQYKLGTMLKVLK